MNKEINKQKVQRLLVNLQDLDTKEVTKENGNLDVEKFNNLPEVKQMKRKRDRKTYALKKEFKKKILLKILEKYKK